VDEALGDAHFSRDGTHTFSLTSESLDCPEMSNIENWTASELSPFRSRVLQAGPNSFAEDIPLKLGECSD
jgi:hypothetical protein